MTKLTIFSLIAGLFLAFKVSTALAQTTSPSPTTAPTGVVPTSAPATGRG